jgi:hypothetical protein
VVGTVSRIELMTVLAPSLFEDFIFFLVVFDPIEGYYRPDASVLLAEAKLR